MKKGAVPVLFEWNSYSLPATRPSVWDRTERPNTPDLPDDEEPVMEVDCHDHDYCYTTEPAAVDLALGETEELRSKLSKLRREMEEMAISCKFGLERFASSDDDIRFYTSHFSPSMSFSFS
ncbi:THAP domain-containing 3 [Labeo rohita]|uniref:THAP domain-containing 3 n=1 Tax=Labeo rohita TaxID=84645 RepID=A0A498NL68_LABRO|nr:THAP domain-containing 3 [Labeo rohita]